MRLLLTDDQSLFGAALARTLAAGHDLRLLPDPRDRPAAAAALTDRDAVVHLVPSPLGDGPAAVVALDRATRGTYNLLTATDPPAAVPRLVLITSLRPFARYPAGWLVDEGWAPRPTATLADLVPYLAELTAREVCRVRPTQTVVLRIGEPVSDVPADRTADREWLLVGDAVAAVERAIALPHSPGGANPDRWRVFHVAGDGGARFPPTRRTTADLGYAPRTRGPEAGSQPTAGADLPRPTAGADLPPPPTPIARREPNRVLILGAGGPLGAVAAEALAPDHPLRLADVRPLAEAAAGPPQSPDAPLPRLLGPPHETAIVDVTDADAVAAAAAGIDAIVNLTVIRRDPVEAFRVNLLGAHHVMRAAAAAGIGRVVHTGPVQMILGHPAGYGDEFGLPEDAPSRPGDDLYFLTKFLGQELVRVFAEEHGFEVPCLLFGNFVEPTAEPPPDHYLWAFSLSWADAGAVLRQAVRVPRLPRPFQVLHANADLPHAQYPNDVAKTVLGWQPKDRLSNRWQRRG